MEPFGPRTEAIHHGRLYSLIANVMGSAKTTPGEVTIGDQEELNPKAELTAEELSAQFAALAEASKQKAGE